MKKLFVYVAGAYTKPDPVVNTAKAIQFGNFLLDHGYIPFVPHLSMYQHMLQARPWQEWRDIDFEWIRKCDALIRLPGESAGADAEIKHAIEIGVPVLNIQDSDENMRHRVLNYLEDIAEAKEPRAAQ